MSNTIIQYIKMHSPASEMEWPNAIVQAGGQLARKPIFKKKK